jgi:hypothetical protein
MASRRNMISDKIRRAQGCSCGCHYRKSRTPSHRRRRHSATASRALVGVLTASRAPLRVRTRCRGPLPERVGEQPVAEAPRPASVRAEPRRLPCLCWGRGAFRNHRRLLAPRRANIIGLPLKLDNEIVGDIDLDNRFVAILQEGFDSFVSLSVSILPSRQPSPLSSVWARRVSSGRFAFIG